MDLGLSNSELLGLQSECRAQYPLDKVTKVPTGLHNQIINSDISETLSSSASRTNSGMVEVSSSNSFFVPSLLANLKLKGPQGHSVSSPKADSCSGDSDSLSGKGFSPTPIAIRNSFQPLRKSNWMGETSQEGFRSLGVFMLRGIKK